VSCEPWAVGRGRAVVRVLEVDARSWMLDEVGDIRGDAGGNVIQGVTIPSESLNLSVVPESVSGTSAVMGLVGVVDEAAKPAESGQRRTRVVAQSGQGLLIQFDSRPLFLPVF
jgi:hypothetical protein